MSETIHKPKSTEPEITKATKPKATKPKATKPKATKEKLKDDIYSVMEQSVDRYFKEVKASTASYLQAVTDLQEGIIDLRRKNVESVVMLQKTMSEKLGTPQVAETTLNLANIFSEQSSKMFDLQNHLMIASIESFSKNIKAFNDNTKSFDENSHKLLASWASVIKEKSKE